MRDGEQEPGVHRGFGCEGAVEIIPTSRSLMTIVCIWKAGSRTCSWVEGQRAEAVPGQPHTLGLLGSRQDPWVPLCEGPVFGLQMEGMLAQR